MTDIARIALPTFLTIAAGFLYGRWKKPDVRPVVDVVMYLCLPALAFTSMLGKPVDMGSAVRLWGSAFLILGGNYILARGVFALLRQKHSGLYLPIVFPNTINIPFPIIFLAFGGVGLAKVTLFYIPTALLVYSVGIHMASGSESWRGSAKEILKVPLIFAAVAGLMVNLIGLELPSLLEDSLEFIAKAAIPLVLIILGINLAGTRVTQFPTALLASALRVGGGLLFGVLAVLIFGLAGVERAVVLFEAVMPAAAFTSILAVKYRNEAELVSSVVFLTTLTCFVTIPVLLYLLV